VGVRGAAGDSSGSGGAGGACKSDGSDGAGGAGGAHGAVAAGAAAAAVGGKGGNSSDGDGIREGRSVAVDAAYFLRAVREAADGRTKNLADRSVSRTKAAAPIAAGSATAPPCRTSVREQRTTVEPGAAADATVGVAAAVVSSAVAAPVLNADAVAASGAVAAVPAAAAADVT